MNLKRLVHKSSSPQFIGRKREYKDKNHSFSSYSNFESEEKILFCFNCAWKFPDRMSLVRKNIHINKCFEGNGKLDIMQFHEEQKIKVYRNLPVKKLLELIFCPICGKNIETNNYKAKHSHLLYCLKNL